MECFQMAKRLSEVHDGEAYVESPTVSNFAETLKEVLEEKGKRGVILFVTDDNANYLDHVRLEIEMRKRKYKVIRTNLQLMC